MSESTQMKMIPETFKSCAEEYGLSDDPQYMNTEDLMNSNDEDLYANTSTGVQLRPVTLTSNASRSSLFPKRKPKPLPKPSLTEKPKQKLKRFNRSKCDDDDVDHSTNRREHRTDSSTSRVSESSVGVEDDLEEPIYDDVYDGNSSTGFRTTNSLTKLSSLPQCGDDEDIYEDVQNQCKSLPGALEGRFTGTLASRINAFDQPLYGETVGQKLQKNHNNSPDKHCGKDGQTERHLVRVAQSESKTEQYAGEGLVASSSRAVSASEKVSRIPLMGNSPEKAVENLSSKVKVEMLYENEVDKPKNSDNDYGPVGEDNIYDTAEEVKQDWLDINDKSESLYEDALAVRAHRIPTSAQSEEPIYDEAAPVFENCRKKEVKKDEPLYDEASVVTKKCMKEKVRKEEPLYDEASVVMKKCVKEKVRKEEPLYDEASVVVKKCVKEKVRKEEPLFDEASVVVKKCVKEKVEKEEHLYDEAAPVIECRVREKPEMEDSVYDEAIHVNNSRLPSDERRIASVNAGSVSIRCRKENPYRLATSVRESFKEESSDEDEPAYYNLLMVKMSMERRNQMLYANLDSQLTMENLEKKAHRLSRLWGDASLSKPNARIVDQHQQLKAVKSDTYMKAVSVDYDEYPGEDVDNDVTDNFTSHVAEVDRLMLRKWILTHILDSEKAYVGILDLLFEHMQTFKSVANTDKSVIQLKDNALIFFKIPELHKSHFQFVNSLSRMVENWSTGDQEVGPVFQKFAAQEYAIAQEYLKNYQLAIKTVHRCWSENPVFAGLTKVIHVKFGKSGSNLSLEELLHKPIVRFQQNTLSMKDLIKSTPLDHPDYDTLRRALKFALNCLNERSEISFRNSNHGRYLVKHSLLVEKAENARRFRHVFLFSDVLICAKQKLFSRRRNFYETKWFIPLCDLQIDQKFSAQADKQSAILHQEVIESLEKELVRLQSDMKSEMKKSKKFESNCSLQPNRRVNSLQKKIFQQEAALLEASPYLELRISDSMFNRTFVFLMSSDYERTTWKEAIGGMVAKVDASSSRITANEVSHLLELQKIPKAFGSFLQAKDISLEKERLSGSLKITIHKLQGLTEKSDTFCAIEIDSFGHFFVKAKTHQCKSQEPSWEEEFDIDLEGAQTLHLLCYKIGEETDLLLGKCALQLSTAWLSENFKEQSVPLTDQVAVVISLQYIPQDKLLRRSLPGNKGMFGVPLEMIAGQEKQLVPLIVTSCIEAIESEGLGELGLYRVSGLSSEVQRLKSAFNKNGAAGAALVKTADVNVLTSLLKLFFRELPESLFTDVVYQKLVKGIGLADPEAKEKFLLDTLRSVPKCNYATIMFVLNHLVKVYQNKDRNKMTLENLATVFGPTMLHPALLEQKPMTMEQRLWLGTNEIAAQATILLFFLKLKANNYAFMEN